MLFQAVADAGVCCGLSHHLAIPKGPMTANLLDIIRDAFSADGLALPDDMDLRSLEGWDSMAHMLFITKLEGEYGIELTGDEIVDMQSVGRIRQILKTNHALEV
jgi:acyl carrier protein